MAWDDENESANLVRLASIRRVPRARSPGDLVTRRVLDQYRCYLDGGLVVTVACLRRATYASFLQYLIIPQRKMSLK